MASQNIQQLFSIIRPEQVEQYLAGKGWQCVRTPEQLMFTLRVGPDGELRNLTLPSDVNHPRFRRLVPNVVFSLAVINGREAIDIANEIADQQVTAAPAPVQVAATTGSATPSNDVSQLPTVDTRPVNVELINGQSNQALQLRSRGNAQVVELPVGESLHIACKPGTDCRILLLNDCEFDLGQSRSPEISLGYPAETRQWQSQGWSVAQGLMHYLQAHVAGLLDAEAGSNAAPATASTWIAELVTEFTFLVGNDLKQIDLGVLNRASARFLMGVRQQFIAANRAQPVESVISLARVLLSIGGQGVVADTTSLSGLAKILEIDTPSAPQRTVEWLSLNARRLS